MCNFFVHFSLLKGVSRNTEEHSIDVSLALVPDMSTEGTPKCGSVRYNDAGLFVTKSERRFPENDFTSETTALCNTYTLYDILGRAVLDGIKIQELKFSTFFINTRLYIIQHPSAQKPFKVT